MARRYLKVYMDIEPDLFKVFGDTYIQVLRMILKQMNKEDNKWASNKDNHTRIRAKLSPMHQSTLERHIRKLKQLNILLPITDGRGVYIVSKTLMEYNG